MNDKPAKIEMVTLKHDAKKNPELAKSHKPGHTWEWPKNSPALKEARTALTS